MENFKVDLFKTKGNSKLKAIGYIRTGIFSVKFFVWDGNNGPRVSWPSNPPKPGYDKWEELAKPINKEVSEALTREILAKFNPSAPEVSSSEPKKFNDDESNFYQGL